MVVVVVLDEPEVGTFCGQGFGVGDAAGGFNADGVAVGEDEIDTDDHFGQWPTREDGAVCAGGEDAPEGLSVVATEYGECFAVFPEVAVHFFDGVAGPSTHQVPAFLAEVVAVDFRFFVDGTLELHAFRFNVDIGRHCDLGP